MAQYTSAEGAMTSNQIAMEKAMGPDHTKSGIFVNHNCWACNDGAKPCRQGNSNRCEYPHARND